MAQATGRSMDQLMAINVSCRVVDLGGFTKAGDALYMPEATSASSSVILKAT
jgi:hypothetical protein